MQSVNKEKSSASCIARDKSLQISMNGTVIKNEATLQEHLDNLNYLWAQLIIDQLVQAKIDHVIASPGLRCLPLLYQLNQRPELKIHSVIDERSAAYQALGMAKSAKAAIALICTSGTAAANYFPAIIEAYYTNIPLVVMTADRPFDLWDVGANQSINQKGLYGSYVIEQLNLPHPTESLPPNVLTVKIHKLLQQCLNQRRPVHLNIPFQEPLGIESRQHSVSLSYHQKFENMYNYQLNKPKTYYPNIGKAKNDEGLCKLTTLIQNAQRGLIIVGHLDDNEDLVQIAQFLEQVPWPIYVDISSKVKMQLLAQTHQIRYLDHPDVLNQLKKEYRPDCILHLGTKLLSNNYYRMLKESNLFEIQVSQHTELTDPAACVSYKIINSVTHFVENYQGFWPITQQIKSFCVWLKKFNQTFECYLESCQSLNHVSLSRIIFDQLEDGDTLILGNSTPIRAFDQYLSYQEKDIKVVTNRGASGIEGLISMSIGYTKVHKGKGKVLLVLGDLSCIHDFSALLSLQTQLPLKIVVINNQRGGIFSSLSLKEYPVNLLETPHEIRFGDFLKNCSLEYHFIDQSSAKKLSSTLSHLLSHPMASFLEIQLDHKIDIDTAQRLKSSFQL